MMAEELGLLPDFKNAVMNGVVTFLSFLVFGSVPILPYVVANLIKVSRIDDGFGTLTASILATAMILIVLGVCKARFTGSSIIKSGLETLFVGAVASGSAYLIGALMEPSIEQDVG
jgi:VIT1/CCC1 family predicted Fe2+/Mn2+ transporter